MKIICINCKDIPCPFCQNLQDKGEYSFGADFPSLESYDSFYIKKSNVRKTNGQSIYELVFESESIDNSFRIYFCPICGRVLK